MPTISTYIKMMDQFSRPLERVSNSVNSTIVRMERMQSLMAHPAKLNINASSAERQVSKIQKMVQSAYVDVKFNAREAVRKAHLLKNLIEKQLNGVKARIQIELPASINVMFANLQRLVMRFIAATRRLEGVAGNQVSAQKQIESMQRRILELQNQINAKTKQTKQSTNEWAGMLKGVAATYLSFQGIKAGINISDDYINTLARLDLVNDKTQTTAELQEKIFQAADRARGVYQDMAGVIGRMGILAADAFSSNDELVAFSELMQKSFRVGGASTMEQQAGMYQLSQAMAAGKLQGDEFRSIMENAPMLAAAIADFTGKSKGELKEMSAEGTITADIIKGAMFNMADDLNAKLETMPKTFGDVSNQIKNIALQQMGPAIEKVSNMLNNPEVEANIRKLVPAFASAATAAIGFLSAVGSIAGFMSTNWTVIEPILWGAGTAMGALLAITLLTRTAALTAAAATTIQTLATFAATVATYGLATAWGTLNAAMKANVIILIISIIIALIVWLVNLWKTNDNFAAGLMRAWNAILNFFDQIPVFFVKVGMGIINAFQNAKVTSLRLMESLVNGVIEGVNWLIEKLNKLPGVQIDAIGQVEFSAGAAAEAEAIRQAGENMISKMEDTAASKAAQREQKVLDMLEERAAKRAAKESESSLKQENQIDYSKFGAGINPNVAGDPDIGKVKEVGKIKDTVDISSEDLKMMRELAEMRNVQNFVTLQPSISFGDTHVKRESDINTIVARITDKLQNDIASSVDSVYV